MRVVFFGTPDVAVPVFDALIASPHDVVAAVTQPDRVRGRGREPTPSPVKRVAEEHAVPVLQPESPREPGFADALSAIEPEILAVVAYGHILPRDVLAVAPAMNVHFSLLPRYRGAAPVQRALLDGVDRTGVSVFLLEPTVDTGPVLLQEAVTVAPAETTGELLARLAPIGARLLLRAIDGYAAGTLVPVEQSDEQASAAPKVKPEEAVIDWSRPTDALVNMVRAFNPRPGAYSTFRGRRLLVWRAAARTGGGDEPGRVRQADEAGLVVSTADGALELLEVQPEGKRRMSGPEFVRGYRPLVGERFG